MAVIQVPKDNELLKLARTLRQNMTRHEKKLWYGFLRIHPVKFYKQRIIERYIVDFYCDKARIAIELDGSQHYEESAQKHDVIRTCQIGRYDILVLRYYNQQIDRNFRGVCDEIDRIVKERIFSRHGMILKW